MTLIQNWKRVATKSWSVRCHAVSALLYSVIAGALLFWPALADHIPLGWFCLGAVVLSVAGCVLRLLDQGIGDKAVGGE